MARPTLRMRWTDTGWARIYEAAKRDSSIHVKAGVVGSAGQATHPLRGNIAVGDVAMMNEFGSAAAGIPQRSFIRSALLWSAKAQSEFRHQMAQVSRQVLLQGVPRRIAMQKVGEWAVRLIRARILENVPPPNAPRTVAEKGHDHALINTDTLYDAIDYEIARGLGE
jgi:hypothetical protein